MMALLALALLLLPLRAHAATVGNPFDTGSEISVEYETVSNRDMEFKEGTVKIADGDSFPLLEKDESIKDFKLNMRRIFVKGSMSAVERVELFFKAGLGLDNAGFSYSFSSPDATGAVEFDGDYGFALGGGAKVRALELANITVVASAEYLYYRVGGTYAADGTSLSDPALLGVPHKVAATLKEWQAGVAAGSRFWMFSPYAGFKYSGAGLDAKLTSKKLTSTLKAGAAGHFGLFGGVDAALTELTTLSVEGRILDEKAFTVGLNFMF